MREFGYLGNALGYVDQPHAVALGHGYLFVADFLGTALQVWYKEGDAVQRLPMPGRMTGVAAGRGPTRALYALDNENSRVRRFALKGAPVDGEEDEGEPAAAKEELRRF